ncbi:MAG TPA: PVC-type heme-binding CxxCH protein, partial [Gemmataceae bacterium]|nr:PVC-type heme-binding CxxCH protein [Gemmataceae bacterium]
MTRITFCFLLLVPAAAFAQANATVPDPDPEIERKSFIVAPGFEVNLFAADPLLAKPIQMNFDPKGRLWVASSEIYPQIKPGEKANDKIVVLEDTDGDGKAEKTTVFADGLLIPTGVEPGDGGAYVANSTELVHLSASREGGKADRTRVVLSGFGTEDTHHIIHTFRWGPDAALFFNQSIYIHSHIETPHGVKRLNAGGIWRFRPESMDLDVFVRGFVNSWGHHFDRWGQSLITDGAYGEGVNHGIPGAYYVTAVGATRLMKGLNPGSPKHCGLEVVSGRHLPDDWQGDVITNDFRGHRVCRFKLGEDGSTFTSREMGEVIKTNHPAFRPIDVKMGPDGAIYIADWYNPIIQHGEVDFRDPRRDHVHGRIWRVTAKGRPLVKKPNLAGATEAELLDHLKAPEDWTRQQAKRVLHERGAAKVFPAVAEWLKKLDPKDAEYEHQLLEALWVYHGFDAVQPTILNDLLNARDHRARAAAVRVLSHLHTKVPIALGQLTARAVDDHPRVRMEAVRALAAMGTPECVAPAFAALDKPVDRTLDYALWLTARDLAPIWQPKFAAGEDVFKGNVKGLSFALQAVGGGSASGPLLKLIQSGKLPKDREPAAWDLIARTGRPAELRFVLDRVLSDIPAAEKAALLDGLEQRVREGRIGPAGDVSRLGALVSKDRPVEFPTAVRLAGHWRIEPLREVVTHIATARDTTPAVRRAALDGVALYGGKNAVQSLLEACQAQYPVADRGMAVAALTTLDMNQAARQAVLLLADARPTDDLGDMFRAFLTNRAGPLALTRALDGKKLNGDVAKVGLRVVRAAQDAKPLTDALTKAGGLTATRTDYRPEEIKAYVEEVLKTGDAARGELVYRRKEATCLTCHAIAGAGGLVGPDMTSIGASAQV